MARYIELDAFVAEIERIEYETNYEPFTDEVFGKRNVCKHIKDFINTLEVKEVDLQKDSLTWKDISLIDHLLFDIKEDYDNGKLDKDEYYKEVLKKFKEQL